MRRLLTFLVLISGCVTPGMQMERECARYTADGRRTYQRGAYAEAREHYKRALALRPGDPDLLHDLGRCAEGLGETKEAETLYTQALDKDSDHAGARQARTSLLFKTGRKDEAREAAQVWLADRPKLAAPYIEDGWLLLQAGDVDSARARFQQALDLEPQNTRALFELGKVYERLGRPSRAAVLYRRSLEIERDQPDVKERLAALKNVPPLKPD